MESAERELDFVIVKNIGDLETSVRRAEEEIDVRLNGEAWATLIPAVRGHEGRYKVPRPPRYDQPGL